MLRIQLEAEENLMCALEEAYVLRKTESLKRAASRRFVLGNMGLYARKIRERAKDAEMDVDADQKELKKLIMAIEKVLFSFFDKPLKLLVHNIFIISIKRMLSITM